MRSFFFVLVVLLFFGCQDVHRPERPENLIPKEKMVQILAESYSGNAARSIRNRTLRDAGIALDSILYSKHGVDSLTFVESNAYYASQITDYIDILTEVEKILSLRKRQVDSLIEQEAKEHRDSLEQNRKQRKQTKDSPSSQIIDPVSQ